MTAFGARWKLGAVALAATAALGLASSWRRSEPHSAPATSAAHLDFRGVNFTAEWPAPYGTPGAEAVLARLPEYGVNAVALVPYGAQQPGETGIRFPLRMEGDAAIAATAAQARALGLKVLLKPQVWVRGRGLYPGDLRFDDPAERARWFASYARFLEHYARLATGIEADLLAVGVEFVRLSPYEAEWRELIALARRHYSGPLVYAANFGEEFESVAFWDALDYIGLDNYYPLPDDLSTDAVVPRIEAVQRRWGKPVLFTEAGFAAFDNGYRRPWDDEPGGALSPQAQARAVEALLRGFAGRPWLAGIFWWKVGTSGRGGLGDGSHSLWDKPAIETIGHWFRPPAPQ